MPLALDSPKDLWGKAKALENIFAPRERLLKACEDILSIQKTDWHKERNLVSYEGGKATLLGQQQAATVRVAVPFEASLPNFPDQSGEDQRRKENTEIVIAACWMLAAQDAALLQRRDPAYDLDAALIETGAAACLPYWQKHPRRGWRPRLDIYNPRYVFYESDENGLAWCAIRVTLTEAQLRGLVTTRGWSAPSEWKAHQDIYEVWHRNDEGVYHAVLGGDETKPNLLLPTKERGEHQEIPVLYVPAGGPVTRFTVAGSTSALVFDQHYGQPFIAPMLGAAQASNYLGRMVLRAGLEAVTPPRSYAPGPDEPDRAPEPEPGETVIASGTWGAIPTINPGAIPFLQAQIALQDTLIQGVGLPGVIQTGSPIPRSQLLLEGLEAMGQQALAPYWAGSAQVKSLVSGGWRDGLLWLMEQGEIPSISLEVTPKGQATYYPQRETRAYEVKDLWPDGTFKIELKPRQTRDEFVRNFQTFQLAMQTGAFDPVYLEELLLGIPQAELMYRKAIERRIDDLQAPIMELFAFKRDQARIQKLVRLVAGGTVRGANLAPDDLNWLGDKGRSAGISQKDIGAWGFVELTDLDKWLQGRIQNLQQMLIPAAVAKAQQGQAPASSAAVGGAAAPTQGSPAGFGNNGGGGLNDALARMLHEQSGSDQGGV